MNCAFLSYAIEADRAPSESWTRCVLRRFAELAASARLHLAFGASLLKLSRTEGNEPALWTTTCVNTGKYTIRKGWRMQDKRAVPGTTDY